MIINPLSQTIEQTHSHLRLIERNLSDQRRSTLRLMERCFPTTQTPVVTPPIITPPSFNFDRRNNPQDNQHNIFRAHNSFRFGTPPPPPPRWPTRSNRHRRNTRISNIIQESMSRLEGTTIRGNIPTSLQIHDATTTCKWVDIKNTTDQEICPITQQNFEDDDDVLKINYCGHIFKKDSLVTWFERSSLCPVCRHNITLDLSNNISNLTNQIITELHRDNSGNNFMLDVSFDIVPVSPITVDSSTNTDISNN